MKFSLEINAEIVALNAELKPLLDRMAILRSNYSEALSREFIAANRITSADVEMSQGDGKPLFGVAWDFGKWLARNSSKKWAEWNGAIYHTADLIAGKMIDTNGRVEHLPE